MKSWKLLGGFAIASLLFACGGSDGDGNGKPGGDKYLDRPWVIEPPNGNGGHGGDDGNGNGDGKGGNDENGNGNGEGGKADKGHGGDDGNGNGNGDGGTGGKDKKGDCPPGFGRLILHKDFCRFEPNEVPAAVMSVPNGENGLGGYPNGDGNGNGYGGHGGDDGNGNGNGILDCEGVKVPKYETEFVIKTKDGKFKKKITFHGEDTVKVDLLPGRYVVEEKCEDLHPAFECAEPLWVEIEAGEETEKTIENIVNFARATIRKEVNDCPVIVPVLDVGVQQTNGFCESQEFDFTITRNEGTPKVCWRINGGFVCNDDIEGSVDGGSSVSGVLPYGSYRVEEELPLCFEPDPSSFGPVIEDLSVPDDADWTFVNRYVCEPT